LPLFLQLPTASEILRIYVVRCFKLVPGILYGGLFLFLHTTFPAISMKYFAKCRSLIKKTCYRIISVWFCSLWWPIRTE